MASPDWTREKVMLALELYLRHGNRIPDPTDPKVIEVSKLLNDLPIHPIASRAESFRNVKGVVLKTANIRSHDPSSPSVGMSRGAKMDRIVWDEFGQDPDALYLATAEIRAKYFGASNTSTAPSPPTPPSEHTVIDLALEVFEGDEKLALHVVRERDQAIVAVKKQQVLDATGDQACEVCGFSFLRSYGMIGKGFIECHHIQPVSTLVEGQATTLASLVLLCADCHRMVHRKKRVIGIERMKAIFAAGRTSAES